MWLNIANKIMNKYRKILHRFASILLTLV